MEEGRQFLSLLPSNPQSKQDLEKLKQIAEQLKYEKENYQLMKKNTINEILFIEEKIYGKSEHDIPTEIDNAHEYYGVEVTNIDEKYNSTNNSSVTHNFLANLNDLSLTELKNISSQLKEKEDLVTTEINRLKQIISSDLDQIRNLTAHFHSELAKMKTLNINSVPLTSLEDDSLDNLLEEENQNDMNYSTASLQYILTVTTKKSLRVENIKRLRFEKIFEAEYALLEDIWNSLGNYIQNRNSFFSSLDQYSLSGIEKIKNEIERLTPIYHLTQKIESLIIKRTEFIAKMKHFEVSASAPERLFSRSFQLIEEEKFRNTAYPFLLKIETDLKELLVEFFSLTQCHYKDNYLSLLQKEIDGRIIHETFFAFDNSGTHRKPKHTNSDFNTRQSFGGNENLSANTTEYPGRESYSVEKRRSFSKRI